jgi:hypothetical protein
MTENDLDRIAELQKEIRKEAYSSDRRDDLLWVMVEKLGQEVLLLRAELEKRHQKYRSARPSKLSQTFGKVPPKL